jgi:hypothetical protein
MLWVHDVLASKDVRVGLCQFDHQVGELKQKLLIMTRSGRCFQILFNMVGIYQLVHVLSCQVFSNGDASAGAEEKGNPESVQTLTFFSKTLNFCTCF